MGCEKKRDNYAITVLLISNFLLEVLFCFTIQKSSIAFFVGVQGPMPLESLQYVDPLPIQSFQSGRIVRFLSVDTNHSTASSSSNRSTPLLQCRRPKTPAYPRIRQLAFVSSGGGSTRDLEQKKTDNETRWRWKPFWNLEVLISIKAIMINAPVSLELSIPICSP